MTTSPARRQAAAASCTTAEGTSTQSVSNVEKPRTEISACTSGSSTSAKTPTAPNDSGPATSTTLNGPSLRAPAGTFAVRQTTEVSSGVRVMDEKGPEAALAWFEPIAKSLEGTEAEEAATYEKGGLLARVGKKEDSIKVLLSQARKYRYPNGSLTDDAYYVASLFLEDLGKYQEAIDVLVEMLKPMEAAYGGASYRRPRFPQAQYRIAVLYRDRFKDRERAKREFWRAFRTLGEWYADLPPY